MLFPVCRQVADENLKKLKKKRMKKILIVDDDADLRASLSSLIKSIGYSVTKAANSDEALIAIETEMPDLILLDITMTTDQEGFDFAMGLLDKPGLREIPIIIVSGIDIISGNNQVAEMAREMRNDPDFMDLSVILLRGIDDETAVDFKSSSLGKSVYLPVAGYLSKPVDPDKLFREIKKVLQ